MTEKQELYVLQMYITGMQLCTSLNKLIYNDHNLMANYANSLANANANLTKIISAEVNDVDEITAVVTDLKRYQHHILDYQSRLFSFKKRLLLPCSVSDPIVNEVLKSATKLIDDPKYALSPIVNYYYKE